MGITEIISSAAENGMLVFISNPCSEHDTYTVYNVTTTNVVYSTFFAIKRYVHAVTVYTYTLPKTLAKTGPTC